MEDGNKGFADSKEQYGVTCAEFMDQLKLLLQQHQDRLVECLEKRPSEVSFVPVVVNPMAPGFCRSSAQALARSSSQLSKMTGSASPFSKKGNRLCRKSCSSVEVAEARLTEGDAHESLSDNGEERGSGSSKRLPSTFSQCEAVRRHTSLHADLDPGLSRKSGSSMGSFFKLGRISGFASLVTSYRFDVCMSIIIISNALFCGVEAEYSARAKNEEPPIAFFWISCLYAAVFAAELALRCMAEGLRFFWNASWAWNYFDALLVLISLFEVVVGMGGGGNLDVPSVRVIRMARIIRVLRIARVMRHLRSLRILIQSVMSTLKSLVWTLLLLAVILYVFAILFTEASTQHSVLFHGHHIPQLEDLFGTVGTSAFTLFKSISGGLNWGDAVEPLLQVHPVWVAFFLAYFAFTYFAVLNVVTGVFCQTAIDNAHKDQEMAAQAQMAAKQHYITQLQALFKQINTKNTGVITLREFEDSMQDEKLRAYFASIDLSIDEAFSLFKLLDRDEAHMLDVDTFVTGCLKLRGQAKSIDVAMMMYETRWNMQKCLQCVKSIEDRFACFQECILTPQDTRLHHWSESSEQDESAVQAGVSDGSVESRLI